MSTPPSIVLVGLTMHDLGVLHQSMAQIFVFSGSNQEPGLLGMSAEDLDVFSLALKDARRSIDESVLNEDASQGPGEVSMVVGEAGLQATLTASLGQQWPGSVRLVTTPRVVALWRACIDLARRSWDPEELGTVSGYRAAAWEAMVALLEPFDPVIADAYGGSHRPGKRYSDDDQRRIFNGVVEWREDAVQPTRFVPARDVVTTGGTPDGTPDLVAVNLTVDELQIFWSAMGDPGSQDRAAEADAHGVSADDLRILGSSLTWACGVVRHQRVVADRDPGSLDHDVAVTDVGLRTRLTAEGLQHWPGVVRVETTPRVLALWRACLDASLRAVREEGAFHRGGHRVQEWEAVAHLLASPELSTPG